eukprot:TRINITY_DN80220_c0_g1_i1.p1 TRINITY_DN80220_c0_g1~~TRINITY_DN80220_c0_g1_i1.p1  ORF type:complete len:201 (+),score=39.61 TRINITY_DN80220_c0_g1_i1:92-694(+)
MAQFNKPVGHKLTIREQIITTSTPKQLATLSSSDGEIAPMVRMDFSKYVDNSVATKVKAMPTNPEYHKYSDLLNRIYFRVRDADLRLAFIELTREPGGLPVPPVRVTAQQFLSRLHFWGFTGLTLEAIQRMFAEYEREREAGLEYNEFAHLINDMSPQHLEHSRLLNAILMERAETLNKKVGPLTSKITQPSLRMVRPHV